MMWNMQNYPTTVTNERMWYFRGQNILWPLLHILGGQTPNYHMPPVHMREIVWTRLFNFLWLLTALHRNSQDPFTDSYAQYVIRRDFVQGFMLAGWLKKLSANFDDFFGVVVSLWDVWLTTTDFLRFWLTYTWMSYALHIEEEFFAHRT